MSIFEFVVGVSIRVTNPFNICRYKSCRGSRESTSHTLQYILPTCSTFRDLIFVKDEELVRKV